LRLEDRQAALERRRFDCTGRRVQASPGWPIGLREDQSDRVACIVQPRQRLRGEWRCSCED
jgi:hypothetical protein